LVIPAGITYVSSANCSRVARSIKPVRDVVAEILGGLATATAE
jgi:hypothetical protein